MGLRKFLFQLMTVGGQWEKALNQLQTIAEMDTEGKILAQLVGTLIQCEGLRTEVFAGKKTPLIFGEPEPWIGWLVEANRKLALGETEAAVALQTQAFEAAPTQSGKLNGEAFEWVADADSRLGPMLEANIDGKYYWVPFTRIYKLEIPHPMELRDLVWTPATVTWTTGGQSTIFIPTRYPGTESQPDGALRMARGTTWAERADNFFVGTGQRILATDTGDHPLLEIRELQLGEAPPPPPPSSAPLTDDVELPAPAAS